ncbi:hypothetical protein OIU74_007663 [Salix koriyanagi]|uniref:Uncharacterized protein n=1 Tax=Salix koriyanagi TaxID=2511006 RepID=A0A9Q0U492_9ROSI|nr:hypothetical protein OIU74_007663 [Salix koriyanagi]
MQISRPSNAGKSDKLVESSQCKLPFSSPDNFSLDHGLFSHSMLRGSATWPEENLPASSSAVSSEMCRSQYKLLKMSCQSMHGVGMDDSNHSRTVAAYAIRTVEWCQGARAKFIEGGYN